MKFLKTTNLEIVTKIERPSDMNRATAKTVSSPTSYHIKLLVDLILGVIVQKKLIDVTNIWYLMSV